MTKRIRALLLYAHTPDSTLSYHVGWPRHFLRHRGFSCIPINLLDRRITSRLRAHVFTRLGRFDAVILLHSVFSNSQALMGPLLDAVAATPQPKAFFIGNEYKQMPEKMAFSERLRVALLVSQSHLPAVHALYRRRLGCQVIALPNTGLDPEVFFPTTSPDERQIDLGYRSVDVPLYVGHDEKRRLVDFFMTHAPRHGLRVDLSLAPEDRLSEAQWAAFLNRCRGQLGTEAGYDYFELTDATRRDVNAYVENHPAATPEEIHAHFFAAYRDPVPMRIISGRHIEAAGTKTVQIMFEGGYDGYLVPDIHYIPLRKDFADADTAIEKFKDRGYCRQLVEAAYVVAVEQLTYEHLLARFYSAFAPLV